MQVKIFDLNEGIVVINENVLLIPELKRIHETYEDPIPAFCFVHFMTDPTCPYANLGESDREEILLHDYPGEYSTEDEPIYEAINKLRTLCETPSMDLRNNAKAALKSLSTYLKTAVIRDDDKSGNLSFFLSALKSIAKINQEYRILDKDVEEEMRIRGDKNLGYDEI